MTPLAINLILHDETNQRKLETEFIERLQRHRVDAKFLLWGKKETERWFAVCQEKTFLYHHREVALLEKNITEIVRTIHREPNQHFNVISLGVGNGDQGAIVLNEFLKYPKFSFFPVDISEDIIRQGLTKLPPLPTIEAYVTDLSNIEPLADSIRKDNYPHHVITLFGSRIGNVQHVELFQSIKKTLRPGDFFLMGVMLKKQGDSKTTMSMIDKMIEMHSTPTFQNFVFTPLERFGFNQSQGSMEIEYEPSEFFPPISSLKIFFILNKSRTVLYNDREFHFQKGERIRLYRSYLYTDENIRQILESHHIQIQERFLSGDKTAAIYLCSV